ncbi:hypothetical protein BC628DRAFT_702707 [Trametes gibbosa]|nr:hypothetical protein BC628DRAFT_702707 [Trametes gibbosa]
MTYECVTLFYCPALMCYVSAWAMLTDSRGFEGQAMRGQCIRRFGVRVRANIACPFSLRSPTHSGRPMRHSAAITHVQKTTPSAMRIALYSFKSSLRFSTRDHRPNAAIPRQRPGGWT